jgi:hypothetical protein
VYLAGFSTPEGAITQGLVELPALPADQSGLGQRWHGAFSEAIGTLDGVGYGGVGARAVLSPGRQLNRALVVSVPERRTAHLRRWLATLTRLETLIPDSARLPVTRAQYDAFSGDFPPMRCRVSASGFEAGGAWIACGFRLAPTLDSLMQEAEAYGYRFGYGANVRPLTLDVEQVRAVRRNLLAVGELRGVPPALVAMQQALAQRLTSCRAICEEYVAVERGEPEQWLLEALRQRFARAFLALRLDPPDWELVDSGFEDELASPMFSECPELQDVDLCEAAITDDEIAKMLLWEPPPLAAMQAAPYRPQPEVERELMTAVSSLPPADEGDAPFFFVSYRRTDLDRVAPVIESVRSEGWRLWYDNQIAGGSEWQAVLEERLAGCCGVLLFVSQPAVESKYVRRELQFADSLGKPIIAVRIEPAELRHGLGLLLGQYQLLVHGTAEFPIRLREALMRVVPVAA